MAFAKVVLANLKAVNAVCMPREQTPVSSLRKEAIENKRKARTELSSGT